MKFTSALLALVAAAPVLADGLPEGAHDPRPVQPRPNVCDDKCDVAFLRFYAQVKDQNDGVARARKMTCKADYSCSTSCGFTAVGCANPANWIPPPKRDVVPPPGHTHRPHGTHTKSSHTHTVTKAHSERAAIPPPDWFSRSSTKIGHIPREQILSHDGPHPTETLGSVAATSNSSEGQLAVVPLSSASSVQPAPAPTAESPGQPLPATTAVSTGQPLPATTAAFAPTIVTSSAASTAASLIGADDSAPAPSTLITTATAGITSQVAESASHVHGEFTQFGSATPSASANPNNAAAMAFNAPIMAILGGLAVIAAI